jgi:hypothetical protein
MQLYEGLLPGFVQHRLEALTCILQSPVEILEKITQSRGAPGPTNGLSAPPLCDI